MTDLVTPAGAVPGSTETPRPLDGGEARCPFPHAAAAATAPVADVATGCPVAHGAGSTTRSRADVVMRTVLRIEERPPGESQATAYSAFQRSMLISATRCTLTYVVFPFLLPFLHFLRAARR